MTDQSVSWARLGQAAAHAMALSDKDGGAAVGRTSPGHRADHWRACSPAGGRRVCRRQVASTDSLPGCRASERPARASPALAEVGHVPVHVEWPSIVRPTRGAGASGPRSPSCAGCSGACARPRPASCSGRDLPSASRAPRCTTSHSCRSTSTSRSTRGLAASGSGLPAPDIARVVADCLGRGRPGGLAGRSRPPFHAPARGRPAPEQPRVRAHGRRPRGDADPGGRRGPLRPAACGGRRRAESARPWPAVPRARVLGAFLGVASAWGLRMRDRRRRQLLAGIPSRKAAPCASAGIPRCARSVDGPFP